MTNTGRLFDIKDLKVGQGGANELDGLSLSLDAGESLVVLGEGSSGTDALLRVLGNFNDRGDETSGTIQFGSGEAKPVHRRGKPAISA